MDAGYRCDMITPEMNRRIFFQSALSAAPLLAAQPGKKYKTALIGSGWWGMNILREALASGECSAVALADPDPGQMGKAGSSCALGKCSMAIG